MMSSSKRVKEGKLRRYKSKFLGSKWTECKAVLYPDSTFIWFDDESESNPQGSIQLTQVAPFFAVGIYTTRLRNRPQLPTGAKVDYLLAFGTGPGKDAKIHWFLCSSDDDVSSWMAAIVSTLPPPPQPPQQQPPPMPPPGYNQGHPGGPGGPMYTQPPPYPQQPQGTWAQQPQGNWGAQGQQYPYAPGGAPPATTVVMAPSSGGHSSGWGTAAGVGGGMLAGGLMGYTLGSMMHPHGGGWGMGYGYGPPGGGGYYDNDTTIINNYNTTNVADTGAGDNFDYDAGGGSSFDYGGDTGGAADDFDFDGGDFDAGGDF